MACWSRNVHNPNQVDRGHRIDHLELKRIMAYFASHGKRSGPVRLFRGPVQEPSGSNGFHILRPEVGERIMEPDPDDWVIGAADERQCRTFVLGKRRKNKRKIYDSKERYQRAHRKARIARLRIWKCWKEAWERDDPEETFSVDSANNIYGAGERIMEPDRDDWGGG
ncbi:unnamed protein product [Cuscuta campestris]|uniref:Uncharacterized protein n=1 Tax=Cuscuta campestris TaxID=132261 RepID=A0A484NK83_9ASTE|nr:unnamed protein product [Cuscuta campestris]